LSDRDSVCVCESVCVRERVRISRERVGDIERERLSDVERE